MEELYQQIVQAQGDKRMLQRLNQERKQLTLELEKLKRQKKALYQQLQAEKIDVEKLESISLVNLFYSIIGQKTEKLDQEKQELAKAQLSYQEAKESVADISEDIQKLDQQIQTLGEPDLRYRSLLKEKYHRLLDIDHESGQEALVILEQIGNLKDEKTEIAEAIDAGEKVKDKLEEAQTSLSKAKNWGTADMLGGGMLTTSMKHGHMDDAKQATHEAQRLLRKFSYELNDIGRSFQTIIDISGGLTFADYFFDGLIVDWFVQDKIQRSVEQVDEMSRKVEQTLTQLEEINQEVNQLTEDAYKQWEQIIYHAS